MNCARAAVVENRPSQVVHSKISVADVIEQFAVVDSAWSTIRSKRIDCAAVSVLRGNRVGAHHLVAAAKQIVRFLEKL